MTDFCFEVLIVSSTKESFSIVNHCSKKSLQFRGIESIFLQMRAQRHSRLTGLDLVRL